VALCRASALRPCLAADGMSPSSDLGTRTQVGDRRYWK
jgi:hypothetical protein